jgi:hypothetical protein
MNTNESGISDNTDEISKMACLIFKMLQDCGPESVVSGEPNDHAYFDGHLTDGVLLDGFFDLTKMAKSLLAISVRALP